MCWRLIRGFGIDPAGTKGSSIHGVREHPNGILLPTRRTSLSIRQDVPHLEDHLKLGILPKTFFIVRFPVRPGDKTGCEPYAGFQQTKHTTG